MKNLRDLRDLCVELTQDKYIWWLIDGRINIPIKSNNFIEEQIIYLTNIYEQLGYYVVIDRNFGETY
jgi:hypothetical protein